MCPMLAVSDSSSSSRRRALTGKVSAQFGQIRKHTRSFGIASEIFIEVPFVLAEHVDQGRQVFRTQVTDFFPPSGWPTHSRC